MRKRSRAHLQNTFDGEILPGRELAIVVRSSFSSKSFCRKHQTNSDIIVTELINERPRFTGNDLVLYAER